MGKNLWRLRAALVGYGGEGQFGRGHGVLCASIDRHSAWGPVEESCSHHFTGILTLFDRGMVPGAMTMSSVEQTSEMKDQSSNPRPADLTIGLVTFLDGTSSKPTDLTIGLVTFLDGTRYSSMKLRFCSTKDVRLPLWKDERSKIRD
uniref:Uncharacterized protein n=1 Tax=Pristionchus pacificus TaxID=54126 RepID=A0A2A6BXI1_PRIPA|eukprot:PDM70473.1 hypothetical protein PRIPAC_46719 [Pristionchus pacificus]